MKNVVLLTAVFLIAFLTASLAQQNAPPEPPLPDPLVELGKQIRECEKMIASQREHMERLAAELQSLQKTVDELSKYSRNSSETIAVQQQTTDKLAEELQAVRRTADGLEQVRLDLVSENVVSRNQADREKDVAHGLMQAKSEKESAEKASNWSFNMMIATLGIGALIITVSLTVAIIRQMQYERQARKELDKIKIIGKEAEKRIETQSAIKLKSLEERLDLEQTIRELEKYASTALRAGTPQPVHEIADKILELDPRNVYAIAMQGDAFKENVDFENAYTKYSEALAELLKRRYEDDKGKAAFFAIGPLIARDCFFALTRTAPTSEQREALRTSPKLRKLIELLYEVNPDILQYRSGAVRDEFREFEDVVKEVIKERQHPRINL